MRAPQHPGVLVLIAAQARGRTIDGSSPLGRCRTSQVGFNRASGVAQNMALSAVPPRRLHGRPQVVPTVDPAPCQSSAADIISAVEFDWDGQHLATGDRGGRVVLFDRIPSQPVSAALRSYCENAESASCKADHPPGDAASAIALHAAAACECSAVQLALVHRTALRQRPLLQYDSTCCDSSQSW